jgi:5'-3' exonuclease
MNRRTNVMLNDAAVEKKFGVPPSRIPDFLALVGDTADGYPGMDGIGEVGAARLITRHGALEDFPPEVLGARREQALLFKKLATLRTDAKLFNDVEELKWRGPTGVFGETARQLGDERLLARATGIPTPFPEKGS